MTKSTQERLEECVAMRLWLRSMQIDEEPEMRDLRTKMLDFIHNEIPSSGSCHVNKINRKVMYMLSTKCDCKIGLVKN